MVCPAAEITRRGSGFQDVAELPLAQVPVHARVVRTEVAGDADGDPATVIREDTRL
jgi:hypothetical protein